MGRILKRILDSLSDVYKTDGSEIVSLVDTEQPVTLVHDVSDMARTNCGPGAQRGFFWIEQRLTETGGLGGTEVAAVNPRTVMATLFPNEPAGSFDVWHIRSMSSGNANWGANLTTATIAIGYPVAFPGYTTTVPYWLVHYADAAATVATIAAGSGQIIGMDSTYGDVNHRNHVIRCPIGAMVTIEQVTSGLAVGDYFSLMWAGPRGLTPPV